MNILTTPQTLERSIFNTERSLFDHSNGEISALPDSNTYEYSFDTTLKHSNATQNIYFSNYVEWQGVVRERWFFDCIDASMLQSEGVFVTKQVHQHYIKEEFPFRTIICRLNTFCIQRCSFRLLFRFYSDGDLISYGYQHIAFTSHLKKIRKLPKPVIEKIESFYVQVGGNAF